MKSLSIQILSFVFLLGACSLQQKNTITKFKEKEYYVANCRVFDLNGKLVKKFFTGSGICLFLKDGSLLYSNHKDSLMLFDKNLNPLWEKKIQAHHQLNQASNGDFLVLASNNHMVNDRLTRFDSLLRINSKGEIVGEFNFYQKIDLIKTKALSDLSSFDETNLYFQVASVRYSKTPMTRKLTALEKDLYFNAIEENTHANSIYEIPQTKNFQLRKGDIIVNIALLGMIFIFDDKLSEILKIIPAPSGFVHDVHVQSDGTLFIYNNNANFFRSAHLKDPPFSSIQVFDYPSMNLVFSHGDNKKNRFFAGKLGGGEFVDSNTLLYSDVSDDIAKIKTYLIMEDRLEILEIDSLSNLGNFQQVKKEDLSDFFKNNKSID